MKENKKKVGILNRGKNNTFVNNRFSGLDIGIQDEGEDTLAQGNRFQHGDDEERSDKQGEALKLRPELYGFGVDLKVLWRKLRRIIWRPN